MKPTMKVSKAGIVSVIAAVAASVASAATTIRVDSATQRWPWNNKVDITYTETAYGTKLMVVKEIGGEEPFVDFLSIYKGYLVEFNLTPNPNLANPVLTEEQIQMCIDFLTNVDFNPVQ